MSTSAGQPVGGPSVTVRLFAGLRDIFDWHQSQIPIAQAPNVARLLESICRTETQREALLDDSGEIAAGVILLINGHHAALRGGSAACITEGDEVAIFPPIAGG